MSSNEYEADPGLIQMRKDLQEAQKAEIDRRTELTEITDRIKALANTTSMEGMAELAQLEAVRPIAIQNYNTAKNAHRDGARVRLSKYERWLAGPSGRRQLSDRKDAWLANQA